MWQPISTCGYKNGEHILVWDTKLGACMAYYKSGQWWAWPGAIQYLNHVTAWQVVQTTGP